jgi:hypothetical protein
MEATKRNGASQRKNWKASFSLEGTTMPLLQQGVLLYTVRLFLRCHIDPHQLDLLIRVVMEQRIKRGAKPLTTYRSV